MFDLTNFYKVQRYGVICVTYVIAHYCLRTKLLCIANSIVLIIRCFDLNLECNIQYVEEIELIQEIVRVQHKQGM